MRVAVVGSRTFMDYAAMCQTLDRLPVTEIVSGGARGADKLAERYAHERSLPVRVFLPKHQLDRSVPYHAKWYLDRNREIVDYADHVVAFWDGHSNGTRYTIDYATRTGAPVTVETT